jgi:hypothetical protein
MPSNEGRIEGEKSDAKFHEAMTPELDLVPADQIEEHRASLRAKGFTEDEIDVIYPRR